MKLFPTLRYGTLIVVGTFGITLSFSTALLAQTPPPPAPAAKDKPMITTPSGLKYVDLVVGTGPAVKPTDHLSVNYVGTLENGTKFDSSYDRGQPIELVLAEGGVIKGWLEGLATMKVGGQRKLIIPPMLAYGTAGFGDVIPPNATLIFKVEVVAAKPASN